MTKKTALGVFLLLLLFSLVAVAQGTTVEANISDVSDMFNNGGMSDISQEELTLEKLQKLMNETGANWTAGETAISQLPIEERWKLCGARMTEDKEDKDGVQLFTCEQSVHPESFDWRNKDGKDWMTPVRSQGGCGSCWAFSAVGVVEAAINIYANDSGLDIDLAEQYFVSDCFKGGDCGGGSPGSALYHLIRTGMPEEDCFPYTAKNSLCTPCSDWTKNPWKIESVRKVSTNSRDEIKAALQEYGPLSFTMRTTEDFFYYQEGVYESVLPGSSSQSHAVVLVGWNDSEDCWILKNSWGSSLKRDGYVKLLYGTEKYENYLYGVTGIGNRPPVVEVSASPTNGVVPLNVAFTGTGSDRDGTIVSYEWDFGDGTNSTEQNPTHTYTSPGIYAATLVVTDDDGATGSNSTEIRTGSWVKPLNVKASSYFNMEYVPMNAIDGNTKTRWIAEKHGAPCWIEFDLGRERQVNKTRVMIYRKGINTSFDVLISNDAENWETVVTKFSVTESDTFVEIPFEQVNARYLKLDQIGSCWAQRQLTEFEVYAI